ncbi:MAG: DNA-3-methyladenine glycosylase family protein [Gemmatimonadota bacterium]
MKSIPPSPDHPPSDPVAVDPVLAPLIEEYGHLEPEVADDPFRRLVLAIVNQQLSTASAAAIRGRLVERFELTPGALLAADPESLTAVGLSRRKAEYVQGIAAAFHADGLSRAAFDAMTDDEVIERLVEIRGVGTWTAKIFLMFALGRPDVFPIEDLGIRRGMTNLFGELSADDMLEVAERWRPERTRACLYLWRAADMTRGG